MLAASPIAEDTSFSRTVILLCIHGPIGVFGLLLNRPLGAEVERCLPDFAAPMVTLGVMFNCGLVNVSSAFAVCFERRVPDESWSRRVVDGVGLIALEDVVEVVADDVEVKRVLSRYVVWSAGQLAMQIAAQGLLVVGARGEGVSTSMPETLWLDVLRRQLGRLVMAATIRMTHR